MTLKRTRICVPDIKKQFTALEGGKKAPRIGYAKTLGTQEKSKGDVPGSEAGMPAFPINNIGDQYFLLYINVYRNYKNLLNDMDFSKQGKRQADVD
ncbi:hypothetical protein VSQ48_10760 [Candidatus Ventrimonas sp. KK005]